MSTSRKRKKETNLVCVIHYADQTSYSTIKELSDVNKEKLVQAKRKRTEVGGSYSHADQCSTIPEFFESGKHGVHLEPCYKRYLKLYIHVFQLFGFVHQLFPLVLCCLIA